MVGALSLGFGEGTATTGATGASGVLEFSSGSVSSGNIGAVWNGTTARVQPLKAAADRSRPPALPDENPNTPLAPVVPAFTDRSTALPLLGALAEAQR